MRNIVDAIIEVVKSPKYELEAYSISHNRANQMGAALEDYIRIYLQEQLTKLI